MKTFVRLFLLPLTLMLAVFAPMIALAQTVLGNPAPATPDVAQLAAQLVDAIGHGQWWIVASVVVSLLTWALRAHVFEKLPGKAGTFFADHPVVGFTTPFVLSAIGGIVTTFASGTPFAWATLLGEVVKVGAGAVAAYIGAKKIAEASVQGAVARGEVATPAAAVALLVAGPQPVVPAAGSIEEAAQQALGPAK